MFLKLKNSKAISNQLKYHKIHYYFLPKNNICFGSSSIDRYQSNKKIKSLFNSNVLVIQLRKQYLSNKGNKVYFLLLVSHLQKLLDLIQACFHIMVQVSHKFMAQFCIQGILFSSHSQSLSQIMTAFEHLFLELSLRSKIKISYSTGGLSKNILEKVTSLANKFRLHAQYVKDQLQQPDKEMAQINFESKSFIDKSKEQNNFFHFFNKYDVNKKIMDCSNF